MHMVVVGGGPTGVEYAGELHDFLIVSFLLLQQKALSSRPRMISVNGTLKSPTDSESHLSKPSPMSSQLSQSN